MIRPRIGSPFICVLSLGLLTACVPTAREHDLDAVPLLEPDRPDARTDRILPSELRRVVANSLAEAIVRLRPEFLRPSPSRSTMGRLVPPSVYLDGRFAGGPEALGRIPLAVVIEIRYLIAMAAKSEFGSYCPCDAGVILVRTGAGGPP